MHSLSGPSRRRRWGLKFNQGPVSQVLRGSSGSRFPELNILLQMCKSFKKPKWLSRSHASRDENCRGAARFGTGGLLCRLELRTWKESFGTMMSRLPLRAARDFFACALCSDHLRAPARLSKVPADRSGPPRFPAPNSPGGSLAAWEPNPHVFHCDGESGGGVVLAEVGRRVGRRVGSTAKVNKQEPSQIATPRNSKNSIRREFGVAD